MSCKSSGIVRRFAPGTRADFALSLINSKLDVGAPLALYIEAAKVGEESIYFGPTAVLLAYGNGWNLQTVLNSNQGFYFYLICYFVKFIICCYVLFFFSRN